MVPQFERCTKEEYDNIINQSKEINLKYLTTSMVLFMFSKNKAFENGTTMLDAQIFTLIMTKIFTQNRASQ